jgi:heptosyltransferase-2
MEHILVIRFSSLGDIILAEPITRTLRQRFPDARLSFLTKARYADVLTLFSAPDRIYTLPDSGRLDDVTVTLRRDGVSLVVDLHRNPRSARVRRALRVRSACSRKEWWRRFSSVRLKWLGAKPSHAIERYAAALERLDIGAEDLTPRLSLPDEHQTWWKEERRSRGIQPGSGVFAVGATHETKAAPLTLWQDIYCELRQHYSQPPLIMGAPNEMTLLSDCALALEAPKSYIVAEESICRAAAVIANAEFLISNDSGLVHLGAALGTPTLSLFGPTHPVLGFAPRGERADCITVNEYCSPCSLHGKRPCHRQRRYCFSRMDGALIVERIRSLIGS